MIDKKKIYVTKDDDETRIDRWLKRRFFLLTQSYLENKLRRGLIRINNKKVKSNYKVIAGDTVSILGYSEKIFKEIKKSKKFIPKEYLNKFNNFIVFECLDFIIINKWAGIFTQAGTKTGISIDDIIKSISNEYNLVHRLDKDTTGLLIIAKNYKSTRAFSKMFRNQKIEKIYLAICHGVPKNLSSIVNLEINKKNSKNKIATITKYKVVKQSKKISLILYKPLTGKMHQLRIVSQYLNCPIIGDLKYSTNNKFIEEKLMLNAFYLAFNLNNHKYEFKSTLPKHVLKFMKKEKLTIQIKKTIENLSKTF